MLPQTSDKNASRFHSREEREREGEGSSLESEPIPGGHSGCSFRADGTASEHLSFTAWGDMLCWLWDLIWGFFQHLSSAGMPPWKPCPQEVASSPCSLPGSGTPSHQVFQQSTCIAGPHRLPPLPPSHIPNLPGTYKLKQKLPLNNAASWDLIPALLVSVETDGQPSPRSRLPQG